MQMQKERGAGRTDGRDAPLLSVIVPVYNAEAYLARCVDSILAQTWADLELLLVNDGSTDRSAALCDAYAERDRRVIALHRPNGGVCAARNAGIDRAAGEYIGFVDADDWIAPDYYAALLALLQRTGQRIGVCNFFRYEDGVAAENRLPDFVAAESGVFTGEDGYRSVLMPGSFQCFSWNKLMHRSIFEGPDGLRYDESLSLFEDMLFTVQALGAAGSLAYTRQPGYYYFIRPGSISHSDWRTQARGLLALQKAIAVLPPAYASWTKSAYYSFLPRLSYCAHAAGDMQAYGQLRREFAQLDRSYRQAYRRHKGHLPFKSRALIGLARLHHTLGLWVWRLLR